MFKTNELAYFDALQRPNSPDFFMWDLWTSIYHLPVVTVSDELDLFTCLNGSALYLDELAKKRAHAHVQYLPWCMCL